jgi:cation diffusion facilitator CzcD-associated flavoprotein CzcO
MGASRACDVVVVGAGPYGLSIAAHLRAAGVDARVFGEPMSFWERQMPAGMCLRSPWAASNLFDPRRAWTLDRFRHEQAEPFGSPVPLDRFTAYGRWFQQALVPDIDRRAVRRISSARAGFSVEIAGGERATARRVVVAAGIGRFAWRPPQFGGLPPELATHTADHASLARFAGRRVVVVGGGQSALESAALLREASAGVEVLVRRSAVHWLLRGRRHTMPVVSRLLYAWPDVGPAGVSHLVARPRLYRRIPRETQDRLATRSIRPAGAAWLIPRLAGVPIRTGVEARVAARQNGSVRLELSDGTTSTADHVLLATGYRVDVARYEFLDGDLLGALDRVEGMPRLTGGLESSVPGLHFAGAPAAYSHGPLMRFVAGAGYAARAVTRAVTRRP